MTLSGAEHLVPPAVKTNSAMSHDFAEECDEYQVLCSNDAASIVA